MRASAFENDILNIKVKKKDCYRNLDKKNMSIL